MFRCVSVRLRGREGEKTKNPVGLVTRVLGEPAAVLYRLGSIINHWNLTKKKSRGFCDTIITTGLAAEKKKQSFAMAIVGLFCGSDATKRCKNTAEASEASEHEFL